MNMHMTCALERTVRWAAILATLSGLAGGVANGQSLATSPFQQPPPPCHPNTNAGTDVATVFHRDDVVHLPEPLKELLLELALRPHTMLPLPVYAEADQPSQLFQYYLLDTHGFQPNVFTSLIPGVNDKA